MKLIFTGLKHSGKTTFARLSAEHFSLLWKDADDLILERISPRTVREFYREEGKDAFMKMEAECVADFIKDKASYALSLGGGAADNTVLMDTLRGQGMMIYLVRPEEVLLKKILEKGGVPPFLDPDDVEGSFHTLFARRDAVYRKEADLVIDLGLYGDKMETLSRITSAIEEAANGR